jgi:hypothetical protein
MRLSKEANIRIVRTFVALHGILGPQEPISVWHANDRRKIMQLYRSPAASVDAILTAMGLECLDWSKAEKTRIGKMLGIEIEPVMLFRYTNSGKFLWRLFPSNVDAKLWLQCKAKAMDWRVWVPWDPIDEKDEALMLYCARRDARERWHFRKKRELTRRKK